jgi:hypothetical protein
MIADEPDMSKESIRKILVHDLGKRKLAAKLVQLNVTDEQEGRHLTLCTDLAEQLQKHNFWIMNSIVMKHGVSV